MVEATKPSFLALADELLIGVIQHVDFKDDLCNLVLACSRLQGLAEPALYQFILVRKGARAIRLSESIARRPIRASFIRTLHIRYQHSNRNGIDALNHSLKTMYNLRELMIESPCCNDIHAQEEGFQSQGKIDYAEYFAFASAMTLESQPRVRVPLQTFTLHSHNENDVSRGAFNMGKNAVIFLHPTLRNLTISCFDIGEDVEAYLLPKSSPTGLQSLTFDECNITVAGLAAILSVPKALQRLTIGERLYHTHGYPHNTLGQYSDSFSQAIALQKDSLRYFKHISEYYGVLQGSSVSQSVDAFTNLKEIELDFHSILAYMLSRAATRGSPILDNLHLRMIRPSQRASDPHPTVSDEDPLLRDMYEWFKIAPHLDFIIDFSYLQDRDLTLAEMWKNEKNHKVWKKIFDLAVPDSDRAQDTPPKRRLKIFIVQSSGFIPPYMYGEARPVETLVFDSHNLTI